MFRSRNKEFSSTIVSDLIQAGDVIISKKRIKHMHKDVKIRGGWIYFWLKIELQWVKIKQARL